MADGGRDPARGAETEVASETAHTEPGSDVAERSPESLVVTSPPEGDGGDVGEVLAPEELEGRRVALDELMAMMRPAVQMDGGDLAVVDVDYSTGVVEVELQGACGSCAISATTLQGGVERLLRERLDWVTEVRGGVDESVDPLESAAMGRGAYVPRYY